MPSRIAIIQGHPHTESYCAALAAAYTQGALNSGAEVRHIEVGKLQFEPNLAYGYTKRMPLEEDLLAAQDTIQWADHLVFVYPTWWGAMPAILKGFIDRTFLPGFAFQKRAGSVLWDKLLQGKSARLLVTMDTPSWYNRLVYRQGGHHVMKRATLQFCGVNPVRITELTPVGSSTQQQRDKWLAKAEQLGLKRA